jgi:type IV pilus assembly protein PilB
MAQKPRKRLGEVLIDQGLLTQRQLEIALEEQKQDRRPLGELLIALGFVRPLEIAGLVAEDIGLKLAKASEITPDRELIAALDEGLVRTTKALPVQRTATGLRVLMVDPSDPGKLSTLRQFFRCDIEVEMVTEEDFAKLVRECFNDRSSHPAQLKADNDNDPGERPIEQITEAILIDGIRHGATDIHFHPSEKVTRLRYRLDGVLQQIEALPRKITSAITSRIKIMASLDISDRRMPQDGRIRMEVDGRQVDLRVSTMPVAFGESIVLRVLDRGSGSVPLQDLGLHLDDCAKLKNIADKPHGLLLVTGPTGSGKTTTLYSTLAHVDALNRNVATIEDPIESQLPFVRQSQVDTGIGFSFDIGLRALLRQDPDVILVGEIRDLETAGMAIKASMTGHLVFSTLHTNTAIGAISRLADMGIAPYLVEDCIIGVLGQRLVRKLCPNCMKWRPPNGPERTFMGPGVERVPQNVGCDRCGGTGYSGRSVIAELFQPNSTTSKLIREGASAGLIAEKAKLTGYVDLAEDGRRKVVQGLTTIEEIQRCGSGHRVTTEEEEANNAA